MVRGIDVFRTYFKDYLNQYVLIGGTACDLNFESQESNFRATKDFDMVLIIEALSIEFVEKFWDFIKDGGYRIRIKNNGKPLFYRFDKPTNLEFPKMIELFSRNNLILKKESIVTPIHIDDTVSSLSAILLNEDYYRLLLEGRYIIDDISILKPTILIVFKAKAWLDLNERKLNNEPVDSKDIKKHKNDIIRIVSEMSLDSCVLPKSIKSDMNNFIRKFHVDDIELKNLNVHGIHEQDIIDQIINIFHL